MKGNNSDLFPSLAARYVNHTTIIVRYSLFPYCKISAVDISVSSLHYCKIAAVIIKGPTSVTRELGLWAEFNCTMACTHSIDWYMEGYRGDVSEICTTMFEKENVNVCKESVQPCQDLTGIHGYTGTLRVLVTEEMAGSSIAVQCGGVAMIFSGEECPPSSVYSFIGYLTGT